MVFGGDEGDIPAKETEIDSELRCQDARSLARMRAGVWESEWESREERDGEERERERARKEGKREGEWVSGGRRRWG